MFTPATRLAAILASGLTAGAAAIAPCPDTMTPAPPLPVPAGAEVTWLQDIVVVAPDDIWAVGLFRTCTDCEPFQDTQEHSLTMHYDGSAWSVVPSPSPPNPVGDRNVKLLGVDAVAPDSIYAAGSYEGATTNSTDTFVLRWDGGQWDHLTSPGVSGFGASGFLFEDVRAVDAGNVWFGGQFNDTPGAPQAAMVHHDGSGFDVFHLPRDPAVTTGAHRVRAIDALGPDEVWAAGSAGGGAVAVGVSYVARWDGSSWSHVPTPHPGFGEILRGVAVLASDDVWVCGAYDYAPPQGGPVLTAPLFLHWDGTGWTQHDSPRFANDLVALAPDDIYGIGGSDLVHWNGTTWQALDELDPPASGFHNLRSLALVEGCRLLGVGFTSFSTVNGVPLVVDVEGQGGGPCPADVDGDGLVDGTDLVAVILAWGPCAGACPADANADGVVNGEDLVLVILSWGSC